MAKKQKGKVVLHLQQFQNGFFHKQKSWCG
uniref:Uncharacterized protein n=1 Tax=Anguilla anguilla TaxID=7936 RepID=A0A0E9WMA1_ANGAN